jgi:hypothetical protein
MYTKQQANSGLPWQPTWRQNMVPKTKAMRTVTTKRVTLYSAGMGVGQNHGQAQVDNGQVVD